MNRAAFLRLLGLAPLAATLKPRGPLANVSGNTYEASQPDPLVGVVIYDERHQINMYDLLKQYSRYDRHRNG